MEQVKAGTGKSQAGDISSQAGNTASTVDTNLSNLFGPNFVKLWKSQYLGV